MERERPSSSAEIGATAGPVRRQERHMHARLKRTALQFLCNIYMGSQDKKGARREPQVDEGRSGDDSLHSLRTALPSQRVIREEGGFGGTLSIRLRGRRHLTPSSLLDHSMSHSANTGLARLSGSLKHLDAACSVREFLICFAGISRHVSPS